MRHLNFIYILQKKYFKIVYLDSTITIRAKKKFIVCNFFIFVIFILHLLNIQQNIEVLPKILKPVHFI